MARVLLTDGTERSALAACRSLVRAGHAVHVAAPASRSLAGVSRGVREHVLAVDALEAPAEFAGHVAALVTELGADVLIPVTDASATALLSHRDALPRSCRLPFPSLAAFQSASDKAAILSVAEAAGFAVPRSRTVRARAEIGGADFDGLTPGVLKPHRSVAGTRRHGVVHFATPEEGRGLLAGLPEEAFPVLVQRRVDGPGVGFFALRWGGVMRASFVHRRLREVPPSGGVSVCRESIAPPPALTAAGTRLLEALDWEGVAMVECKHDLRSDRYHVIEINPRFWGSLQLAIDAGVDFPALLVECALGGTPTPVTAYRVGVRSRWGWGEMDYIYLRTKLRASGESRLGAFARAATAVLRWRPGRDRAEVFRWSDPGPFVTETLRRLGVLR